MCFLLPSFAPFWSSLLRMNMCDTPGIYEPFNSLLNGTSERHIWPNSGLKRSQKAFKHLCALQQPVARIVQRWYGKQLHLPVSRCHYSILAVARLAQYDCPPVCAPFTIPRNIVFQVHDLLCHQKCPLKLLFRKSEQPGQPRVCDPW